MRAGALRQATGRAAPVDALLVGTVALVVGIVGASRIGGVRGSDVTEEVLTPAAAAVAVGAVLLGAFAARLIGDPRPRWLAAALAVHAVVVIPSTAIATGPEADPALRSLQLVAHLVTIGLLAVSLRPPPRVGVMATWTAATVGALLAVAASGVAAVVPGAGQAVLGGHVVLVTVLACWTAVAAAVLADGLHRREPSRRRVGLGLVVLGGAQLYEVLDDAPADLRFGALRLLGLVIVVVGLAQLVTRTTADLRSEREAQQEELAAAALHMERARDLAAERDHELRNGLAGLAGITHLLRARVTDGDQERLRQAVLAELTRLHALLDPETVDRHASGYLVAPVLDGLVVLRRSGGADVDLHVQPGLRARGDSAVLAQVVTNLLANCDRHAPGAPLTVWAGAVGNHAVVRVRDTGPGLPPGREESVLRPGVRDARAGGTGLGLSISDRLVAREGGTLSVTTVADPRGCLATVALPLGPVPPAEPVPPQAPAGRPAGAST